MDRRFLRVIGILFWFGYAALVWACWGSFVEIAKQYNKENANGFVVLAVILVAFALLAITSKIADVIAVKREAETVKLTPHQIRERAEHDGEQLVKENRLPEALKLYESAGLTHRAVDVARQLNDKPALVRLYSKLGYHDKARRLSIDLKDFEAAAQASALMNEIEVARELYKEAAAAQETKGVAPLILAGLWDRAGDYLTAAKLYEEASEMELAAECFLLMRDPVNAHRCEETGRLLKAYERRSAYSTSTEDDQYKADMAQGAKLLEEVGDFLGAGLAFRKADQWLEAAIAFERFHEWERAARAYEEVGLKDRADLARTRLPAIEEPKPEEAVDSSTSNRSLFQGPPSSAPLPANAPTPPPFVPVNVQAQQAQFAPVFANYQPAADPELQVKIAQRVRRGNFVEAAAFALEGMDWLMAAALYEQGGELLRAADLYRKIGKITDAMFCLERLGRVREAALLGMASGQEDKASEILLNSVMQNNDQEAGVMLMEKWIRDGRKQDADELLHARLAPEGVNEGTAAVHYLYAQLLEKNGDKEEAAAIYRQLLAAGADSTELRTQVAALDAESDGTDDLKEFDLDSKIAAPATNHYAATAKSFRLDVKSLKRGVMSGAPQNVSLFGAPQAPAGGDSLFETEPAAVGATALLSPTQTAGPSQRSQTQRSGVAAPVDPFSGGQRYELNREISRGGMGVVYEATDTALGRNVALKLILNQQASQEEFQQFLLEARAIARLNHPNVVTMYDIGLMDYQHYITMELVTGGSLGDYVQSNPEGLPLKEALRIFIEISSGLQAAHDAGIVHRDIKPGNLLLTDKRVAKIVDFGLAKLGAHAGSTGETIFRTSGTPGYMAPEQIEGEESLPRVDIYAAGIVLFFMLVGKPPHVIAGRTKPRQIAAFQLAGQLPSLREQRPDVPPAIEEIYKYTTALEAEDRYQSIHQFLPLAEQWYASL